MNKSALTNQGTYFEKYTDLVETENLITALIDQQEQFISFLKTISPSKENYAYEDGKWTVKEVVQHIIDTERIFAYRSLVFGRMDTNPLPGFDENEYAKNSFGNLRDMDDLVHEFNIVRQSTLILFKSFTSEQLMNKGTASNNSINALELGFTIVGHCTHHVNIFKERYSL